MLKINYNWVKEQFAKTGVSLEVGTSVLELLKSWESASPKDVEQAKKAVEIFSKLSLGHALLNEPTGSELWEDAMPGFLKVADVVRVKHDAFDGPLGNVHNGRVGKIVAIRSGDIIVNSTDDVEPSLNGVHYTPNKLQKRVR
jgi:hypothetical protein